jgi:hypothetical protein
MQCLFPGAFVAALLGSKWSRFRRDIPGMLLRRDHALDAEAATISSSLRDVCTVFPVAALATDSLPIRTARKPT